MVNPKYISINGFKNVNITNSSIRTIDTKTSYRSSGVVVTNYNQDCDVNITNCYIEVGNILTTNEASNKNISLVLQNDIFNYDYNKIIDTTWEYNSDEYPSSFFPTNTYVFIDDITINNIDNLDTSATDSSKVVNTYSLANKLQTSAEEEFKSNLYYSYKDIPTYNQFGNYKNYSDTNVKGITSSPTNGNDFYDGSRDGVGGFYFPTPLLNVSATDTSGTTPFTTTAYTEATISNIYPVEFDNYNLQTSADSTGSKKYDFDFDDGIKSISYSLTNLDVYGPAIDDIDVSAIDTTLVSSLPISADYTYDDPGVYTIQINAESLNGWNTYNSPTIQVSAFALSLSADIEVYDKTTNTIITSATAYQDIRVKVFNFVGGITSFDIDFNDTSASGVPVDSSEIFVDYYYLDPSSGPISITLYNNMLQSDDISASFTATSATQMEYYVDINSSYDSNLNNIGNNTNPFNYDEFHTRITTSGGSFNDIYYLRGMRELTSESRVVLEIDESKSFIIDVWDAKLYGPWVLIINDYETTVDNNSYVSFKGSLLKNGIIYNKLNGAGGGILELSYITDMYIVHQGFDSILYVTQDELNKLYDQCKIKASTIYSQNGIEWNKVDKEILPYTFN